MTKVLLTISMLVALGLGLVLVQGCDSDKQSELNSIRQEMNTVTVDITNSNGSISQVKLQKQGPGYVGPEGEYYETLPTEVQLKPVYGF